MAQHDYVIANGTGAAVRSDLNNALAAIVTQNSGATEPATMYAYQWWADTTTGLLKLRNGANNAWITLRELDGTLTIEDGTAGSPGLAFADDLNTGVFSPGADQVAFTAGGTARLTASTTGITSALPIDVPLGSASAPTVTFTGDLNTGIYSPGADQVAISTGGTSRITVDGSGNVNIDSNTLYVDAANNRVGIGTSTPSEILDCKGNIVLGAQNAAGASLQPTSGSGTNIAGSALVLRSGRSTGSGSSGEIQILPSPGSTISGTTVRGNGSNGFYMKLSPTSWNDHPTLGLLTVALGTSIAEANRSGLSGDATVLTIDGCDTSSQTALEIVATNNGGGGDQGFIRFYGSSSKNPYATIVAVTPGVDYTSGNLAIRTYNAGVESTIATFTNTGRVGIGTTSPGSLLHVAGEVRIGSNASYYARIDHDAASTGSNIYDHSDSGGHIFKNGGTERLRIDSSGRLLVGTSSTFVSGANLQVAVNGGANANRTDILCLMRTGGTGSASGESGRSGWLTFGDQNNFTLTGGIGGYRVDPAVYNSGLRFAVWNGDGGQPANSAADLQEAMRINDAGELLVGYTSDNGAYKLQVNSQIFATSATVATSDGRFKENVATLGGCFDLIKALRPVSFTWKPQQKITRTDENGNEVLVREGHNFPDGTQVGFIAQEVQEVLAEKPWLTSVIKQNVRPAVSDSDGNELAPEEEFLGIAEGNLIAVLTSALQEAIGEIESLKARVTALEGA